MERTKCRCLLQYHYSDGVRYDVDVACGRQYVTHLRYLGFRFAVLPESFLVHMPHPASASRENFGGNREVGSSDYALVVREIGPRAFRFYF